MLRWLLIALIIYLIYKLITGPKSKKQNRPFFTLRFDNFSNRQESTGGHKQTGNRKKHLDHIEDAEFEDITEEVTKEKKTDQ